MGESDKTEKQEGKEEMMVKGLIPCSFETGNRRRHFSLTPAKDLLSASLNGESFDPRLKDGT